MPTSAQLALFIWLGLILAFMMFNSGLRQSSLGILRLVGNPKILVALALSMGWITGEVLGGRLLGVWDSSLTTSTILWAVLAGFGLRHLTNVAEDEHFVRKQLRSALGVPVAFSVLIGLFPPDLLFELLVIQPGVTLLAMLSVVTAGKPSQKAANYLVNALLIVAGCSLLANLGATLYGQWGTLSARHIGLQFFLPIWLALGALPLIYGLGVIAAYGQAFTFLRMSRHGEGHIQRLGLILAFGLRARELTEMTRTSRWDLANAATAREVRETVKRSRDPGAG